ncbi:MAG TPA: zinc ribbon domain-containing protein [bacterium]|mgnify:CR=1 FL=1|nr:zinc ribbon domain-containing protein [bacterium]
MPTYDYICDDCGHQFEKFQSITSEPLTTCPKCQGKLRRLIGSGNGFIFKGHGFYSTDYRSEKYRNDKKKTEGSTSKGSDSSSNKTDKKVA